MNKQKLLLILILSLLINHIALASGGGPPAPLSQSGTPTATHQIYMPIMQDSASQQGGNAPSSVPGGSALTNWILGVGLLAVLMVVFFVLQTRTRRKR